MNKKKFFTYFTLAASLIILAVGLTHLNQIWGVVNWVLSALSPVLLGLCIAFVLNVIMSFIEGKLLFPLGRSNKKFLRKIKRPLAIILTLVVAFGFFSLIVSIIFPSIRESIDLIIKELPGFMRNLMDSLLAFMNEHEIEIEYVTEHGIDWIAIGDKVIAWLKANTGNILNVTTGVAGNIFGVIFDFILAFIIAIYVLAGKEKIHYFFHNLLKAVLKEKHVQKVKKISKLTYSSFAKFITGQITEAVILGVLCAVGMLILKIPMASVVSVIVGVTALIPIFGAWIGGALGMFFILLVDPFKALVFIIFLLILQQLEGNIIYPKVVGETIGLPGILVLCAVTIGGGLGGIPGILFSVPITSVIYTLIHEFIEAKRIERNRKLADMICEGGHDDEVNELLSFNNSHTIFAPYNVAEEDMENDSDTSEKSDSEKDKNTDEKRKTFFKCSVKKKKNPKKKENNETETENKTENKTETENKTDN